MLDLSLQPKPLGPNPRVAQENGALKKRLESVNWSAQQEAERAAIAHGKTIHLEQELQSLRTELGNLRATSEVCPDAVSAYLRVA